MKHKLFSLFLLTVILLSVAMISAAEGDVIFNPTELILEGSQGKVVEATFKITNERATDLTEISDVPSDLILDTFIIASSNLEITGLEGLILEEDEESEDITLSVTIPADQEVGEYAGTIEIWGALTGDPLIRGTIDITLTVSEATEEYKFCQEGSITNDLKIKKVKIKNHGPSEDGEDETWFPLDRITVEVELENNGNEELEDIVFELGLFEEGSLANIAEDMLWMSEDDEEIEIGDIEEEGEDDEIEHTFEFRINPEEVEKGDYILMIKTYPDGDEDEICIDNSADLAETEFGTSEYYAKIEIRKEDEDEGRAVVVDVEGMPLIKAQCDARIIINPKVWNLGDVDQEQVKVNLYNEELGIDLNEIVREDLDEGEKEQVEFSFTIPKDAKERVYFLEFRTYYEYDEDDDEYDENSDVFRAALKVEGNCIGEAPTVQITAELDPETPEAIAGKQVIIKTTLKNTGDTEATYLISISGNTAWSSLSDINPQSITLGAGESEDVSIILNVNDDAEGDKELTVRATYNGQTTEQEIALSITEGVPKDIVTAHLKENWFIYLIVIVNIILIIAIIAVVKSMSKVPAAR